MAKRSQQLRQSFLVSGAGAAVLFILFIAWLSSSRIGQVLERQGDVLARESATRVAAALTQYAKDASSSPERLPAFLGVQHGRGQLLVVDTAGVVIAAREVPLIRQTLAERDRIPLAGEPVTT